MGERQVITVSQLNMYIKRLIDSDKNLKSFYIRGELSNCKIHYTGHIYLTLKDEKALVRGVMFKSSADRLKFRPEDGMKVILKARASVFERDGQYQLYIDEMHPDGAGELAVALEQLKAKLDAEGLFSGERKKPIPRYPEAIGLITSPTGAAVRDMLQILKRRYPLARVYLYPAQVQGEGAAAKLKEALEYFNGEKAPAADVLIIGRGGGSIEELWAFNEEMTARAIAASKIPVISAVGHETDFTIADFVADLRAPTPSAAAELAAPDRAELLQNIRILLNRASTSLQKLAGQKKSALESLKRRRGIAEPRLIFELRREMLDREVAALQAAGMKILAGSKARFEKAVAETEALSPLKVLSRGYSITKDGSGNVVKSIKEVSPGDRVITRLGDGEILSSVLETKAKGKTK